MSAPLKAWLHGVRHHHHAARLALSIALCIRNRRVVDGMSLSYQLKVQARVGSETELPCLRTEPSFRDVEVGGASGDVTNRIRPIATSVDVVMTLRVLDMYALQGHHDAAHYL